MMRHGFTLIEVLIVTLIAAILSGILYSTFYQTNRSTQTMNNLIDVHEKIVIATSQLERDLSGAFIPAQEKQQEQIKNSSDTEKKQQKPITHIFYSVNKDKHLDTLTFITNNSLQVYWSARAGGARPRSARVVYRLVPEAQRPGSKNQPVSYALMRQESSNLNFDAYKSDATPAIKAFTLLEGIKELKISFGAELEKKEKNQQQKTTKKPEIVYQKFDDWNMEESQNQNQEQETKRRKVPHDVEILLSVWDAQKKYATTVTLKIEIIPDVEPHEQKQSEKVAPAPQEQDTKNQKAPQAPGSSAPGGGKKIALNTMQRLLSGTQNLLSELNGATS